MSVLKIMLLSGKLLTKECTIELSRKIGPAVKHGDKRNIA